MRSQPAQTYFVIAVLAVLVFLTLTFPEPESFFSATTTVTARSSTGMPRAA